MIVKAPAFFAGSSSQAHALFAIPSFGISLSPCPPPLNRARERHAATGYDNSHIQSRCRRSYATVSEGSEKPFRHQWPSSGNPTPYEIFNQHHREPYSKAKFYELVKIYHPDRHMHSPDATISEDERLERYRLIVAANEILCDTTKRRSYDLYGLGWGGSSGIDYAHRREADRSWRQQPGNASMNATWEDWEQWYAERHGNTNGDGKGQQHPVFMSNELFVFLLCFCAMIVSVSQARRAGATTASLMELRDQKHKEISHDMRKRRDGQAILNRHERVESFLRQRDGWNLVTAADTHVPRNSERDTK